MAKGQQIRIKLKAYDNYVVDESARKIAETVLKTQAKVKGPVPLPTQIHRYCVIRSPHVDKKSREHFEQLTIPMFSVVCTFHASFIFIALLGL